MKILIVTSEITYIPDNCQDLFDELMKNNREHIAGLVILQNITFSLFLKTLWLYTLGCSNFATTLLKNTLRLPLQAREKHFRKHNLPVFRLTTMNDPFIIEWVKKENIDLIINVRTRCIYKKEILNAPKLGCVNIHHGILPEDRGIFCDLYALHENRPAGITLHRMNEKIDGGDILFTRQISKTGDKNYIKYLARTGKEEAALITALLDNIKTLGTLPEGKRNDSKRYVLTHTPTRRKIRDIQKGGMVL